MGRTDLLRRILAPIGAVALVFGAFSLEGVADHIGIGDLLTGGLAMSVLAAIAWMVVGATSALWLQRFLDRPVRAAIASCEAVLRLIHDYEDKREDASVSREAVTRLANRLAPDINQAVAKLAALRIPGPRTPIDPRSIVWVGTYLRALIAELAEGDVRAARKQAKAFLAALPQPHEPRDIASIAIAQRKPPDPPERPV